MSDLEWKIIYVGSAESEEYDQVLDSVLVGPVPAGRHMFVFQVSTTPAVSKCSWITDPINYYKIQIKEMWVNVINLNPAPYFSQCCITGKITVLNLDVIYVPVTG